MGLDPREVDVPVIGGHAGVTILPLLSQVEKNLFSIQTITSLLICIKKNILCKSSLFPLFRLSLHALSPKKKSII